MAAAYLIGSSSTAKRWPRQFPTYLSVDPPGRSDAWSRGTPQARVPALTAIRARTFAYPVTWRADDGVAGHELNVGAVTYAGTFSGTIADVTSLPQDFLDAKPILESGVADARCLDGMLLVSEIRSQHYAARPMGRDNYHAYDYSLFHTNLRRNAEMRVAQYLAQHAPIALQYDVAVGN